MKKAGDSCNLAKQVLPICFVFVAIMLTGVSLINNKADLDINPTEQEMLSISSYERQALEIPTKIVDESGNVLMSSTGFTEKSTEGMDISGKEMNESAKQAIDNVFNGTYIMSIMKNSDLDNKKKSLIYNIFGEKEEVVEETEEENIVIPSENVSGEEAIDVDQVVNTENDSQTLKPGQESVWLYEESQVPDNYIKYYDMTATAYCLCKKCTGKTPGSAGYGRTASGLVIVPGTSAKVCAVSKNQIPLGTHIYVQGLNGAKDYGYAVAADTGGAITTNRIDLYFDNHSTCLQWGRRSVRVYILPEE